jgi:outer membrane protein insertion porin family
MTPKLGKYQFQTLFPRGSSLFFMVIILAGLSFQSACVPSRHVPQGKLLLQKDPLVKGARSIEMEGVIKTKANRRVLIPKFYLALYNLGTSLQQDSSKLKKAITKGPERNKVIEDISRFLREGIGEAPVLVNKIKLQEDSLNLLNAYAANGFFNTHIEYKIDTLKKRRANVNFEVEEGKAFYIKRYFLDIQDPTVNRLYKQFYARSSIKAGDRMSYAQMATERVRIANQMRDNGYFTFSPRLVNFEVDTTGKDALANDSTARLELLAKVPETDSSKKWMDLILRLDPPPGQYRIRTIYVDISSPRDAIAVQKPDTLRGPDLTEQQRELLNLPEKKLGSDKRMTFRVSPELINRMQFNFIADRIFLKEGELYSQDRARLSLNRLQELAMLQYAIINYEVIDSLGVMDVAVEMRLSPQYQLKAGFEAYNNNFNGSNFSPVLGASFGIRNKNTFGRAELLDISASGDVGFLPNQ